MYAPDRIFLKDIKQLDSKLDCHYEREHGHFVITYDRAAGGSVPILLVEGQDGGFRQPDRREILKLKKSDIQRVSMEDQLKAAASYMEKERDKTRRNARDNIRNMTKDDKHQLASKFARLDRGKHNSIFRRVGNKPKGKVFN